MSSGFTGTIESSGTTQPALLGASTVVVAFALAVALASSGLFSACFWRGKRRYIYMGRPAVVRGDYHPLLFFLTLNESLHDRVCPAPSRVHRSFVFYALSTVHPACVYRSYDLC